MSNTLCSPMVKTFGCGPEDSGSTPGIGTRVVIGTGVPPCFENMRHREVWGSIPLPPAIQQEIYDEFYALVCYAGYSDRRKYFILE